MEKIQDKAEELFPHDTWNNKYRRSGFIAGANEVIQHPQEYIDCCVSDEEIGKLAKKLYDEEAGDWEAGFCEGFRQGYKAAHPAPDCCVWVDVKERLPEFDKAILGWNKEFGVFQCVLRNEFDDNKNYCWEAVNLRTGVGTVEPYSLEYDEEYPTHWQAIKPPSNK